VETVFNRPISTVLSHSCRIVLGLTFEYVRHPGYSG
jgi:hypothetical protein